MQHCNGCKYPRTRLDELTGQAVFICDAGIDMAELWAVLVEGKPCCKKISSMSVAKHPIQADDV